MTTVKVNWFYIKLQLRHIKYIKSEQITVGMEIRYFT